MSQKAAREACSFFLGRLQAEAFRLRDIAFPGRDPGPQKWLNLVDGVIKTAQDYLKKAASRNTPPNSVSGLIEDAELLGELTYQALQHVAGVDATQIPEQMIAPFQRWVTRLQISETIFFRAEHLPNYELGEFDYRGLANINSPSKGLLKTIGAINWPALRVTVPAQAMGMLPHFAVVSHELGHAIQDRIKPDFAPHQQALTDAHKLITNRLTPHNISFGSAEFLRAQKIVDSWTNELKADAVGYCLVGPAFFFALFGFLELSARSYGIAPSHPPSDLRRDVSTAE